MSQVKTASTEMQLIIGFKELASKKPIEKITIKEITDKAGVIRPTFYNYFPDKYSLMEAIIKKELVIPCKEKLKMAQFEEGVVGFLEDMAKDKDFYRNCVVLEGQNSFEETLSNALRDMILSFVNEDVLKKRLWFKWLTPKLIADFFAESFTYAICEWVKTDMTVPKEEIWECFLYLTNHSLLEMILEAKEGLSKSQ